MLRKLLGSFNHSTSLNLQNFGSKPFLKQNLIRFTHYPFNQQNRLYVKQSFVNPKNNLFTLTNNSIPKNGNWVSNVLIRNDSNQKRFFYQTKPNRNIFRIVSFVGGRIVAPMVVKWVKSGTTKQKITRSLTILLVIGGSGVIFIASHLEVVPETGRVRFIALSEESERELGMVAYTSYLQRYKGSIIADTDNVVKEVKRIAESIIMASGRNDIDWKVHVVKNSEKNAFVLPTGKIFVFTGILPVCETEDGLAFILGHEIGHVMARHQAEKLSQHYVLLIFYDLFAGLIDPTGHYMSNILYLLSTLHFSRKMETEADFIGLDLMDKAHFNIKESAALWERMRKANGGSDSSSWLSTHPSHQERIEFLNEQIKKRQKEGTKLIPPKALSLPKLNKN